MIHPIRNAKVVITGAGSGIGRELAVQLAARGSSLMLVDLSEAGLAQTAEKVRQAGGSAITAVADVANEEQVNAFASLAIEALGTIDLVINNAGITRFGDFPSTSPEAFRSVMDVNFWGVVYTSRAFINALCTSQGSLVNVSSLFGLVGIPGQTHYCSSKFAVRGFTEALRAELAPRGVYVGCVHPGGIRTSLASNALFDQSPERKSEVVKQLEKTTLKLSASDAARIILNGIERRSSRILVGRDAKLLDLIQRCFPVAYQAIIQRLMRKTSKLRKQVTA
ncbi:SDR family oxidoreductase [Pseudomonas sp. CrR25]|nr:SDR family oxidoreductase [Pseudomonas sp. CrR25]